MGEGEAPKARTLNRSMPLGKCLTLIVVYAQNGERSAGNRLPFAAGGAGWEGNVSIKWMRRIKLGDKPWYSRRRLEIYRPMPDGRSRGFTWLIDAKSSSRSPARNAAYSPGQLRKCATGVEAAMARSSASMSQGRRSQWQSARLTWPVLSQALDQLTLPGTGPDQPALLESSSIDRPVFMSSRPLRNRERERIEFGHNNNRSDLHGQAWTGACSRVQIESNKVKHSISFSLFCSRHYLSLPPCCSAPA